MSFDIQSYLYLLLSRFSCAALKIVNNESSIYDYDGPHRVWDGKTIRDKIRGRSNLYIFEEQVRQIPFCPYLY